MIYKIYSVKDVVAGQFSEPRIFMNEGLAVRWFKNLCEKSEISSDLSLYYLGEILKPTDSESFVHKDTRLGKLSCNHIFDAVNFVNHVKYSLSNHKLNPP